MLVIAVYILYLTPWWRSRRTAKQDKTTTTKKSVFLQLHTGFSVDSFSFYCGCVSYDPPSLHLAQVWYGEAECCSIARARIHIIPNKEDDLQQPGECITFPKLFTSCCHRHHIRLDVVQLFLKLQLEQDGLKPWHQPLHTGHLEKQERGIRDHSLFVATVSVCVSARVWEHAIMGKCSEFIHYRNLQLNKAPLFNSMRTLCVSNLLTNHLRKRTISTLSTTHTDTTTSLWLVSFKSADNLTITILSKRSVYFFPALSFAHVYASFLTTTPNCSDSAKSSYSSFISARTPSWSGPGSCLIRF